MAQPQAQNYSDTVDELKNKAADVANEVSNEARSVVDKVVAYTKANPVEAAAIAAGVAFVAGGLLLGPRLLRGNQERDYQRLLRQAYREADRIREDSTTWNRLTDWVGKNVPSASSWR